MSLELTRQQVLDAIIPLFHLNRWVRSPFDSRREMHYSDRAVYWMKKLVIREAMRHGLCFSRVVAVERPCKTCNGTGDFKRMDYDGEVYAWEDCRRCNATGKVILKFLESTICSVRWHTPQPKADGLEVDWEKCESTDWVPEQPGCEFPQLEAIRLLNEAERAICGDQLIPSPDLMSWVNNPLGYSLYLGTVATCFVCGYPPVRIFAYEPEIFRPAMRWKQAICDACVNRAFRWPRSWPANLSSEWRGRWNFDKTDNERWKSRVPLPAVAETEVISEWLARRGVVVGRIPPGEIGWYEGAALEVLAHRGDETFVRIFDKHPAAGMKVPVQASMVVGSSRKLCLSGNSESGEGGSKH